MNFFSFIDQRQIISNLIDILENKYNFICDKGRELDSDDEISENQ